jgi:hypothetical protein
MHSPSRGPATIVRGVEMHDALGRVYTVQSARAEVSPRALDAQCTGQERAGQAQGRARGVSMQDDQGDDIADALDRFRRVDWSAGPSCAE